VAIPVLDGTVMPTTVWPDADAAVLTRDLLERAFATLDPEHAIAVSLRFYADLTVPQIAQRLGIAEGTVKSRLHHALRRLRAAVERAEEIER
jgi:RNA polymerase sigma-70 factor (ECF subfamily)